MSPEVARVPLPERAREADPGGARPEMPIERAVLLTVLYSDLFDYPLTEDELYRYLVAPCPDRARFEQALAALDGHAIARRGGYVCRTGRDELVELRRRRRDLAARRWPPARRFARWLMRVPFLRMVAVCGSQAVENGDRDGDVDLFLITEPGRLWIVHTFAMALRRAGRILGIELCPNYLLTADALAVVERDLYTAREIAQAMPLWGGEVYRRFLEANRWVEDFLPQVDFDDRRRLLEPVQRGRLARAAEKLLAGAAGQALDRALHRALLRYYELRLRRHGWTRAEVEKAYRHDRQVVITGGFGAAVARRFVDAGSSVASDRELRRAFYGEAARNGEERVADPLYAGIMERRYGPAAERSSSSRPESTTSGPRP